MTSKSDDVRLVKIGEKLTRDGYRKIVSKEFQDSAGTKISFEIKLESHVACALVLDGNGRVVLVEQFRPGPELVLLELPGGAIEYNEEPMEAMKRGLLEETGYVGDLIFVASGPTDAYSTMIRHHYVCVNAVRVQDAQPIGSERLRTVTMSREEFMVHLRTAQLSDVATAYLGIDLLARMKIWIER